MKRKKRRYRPTPPPPANAESYILVRTKEGSYWRRKRGTVKRAVLNEAMKKSADAAAITSPAAKRVQTALAAFLHRLNTGRFIANVSAKLKKAWKERGEMNYSFFNGYDLQPDYPMGYLLSGNYTINIKNDELIIYIPVNNETVKPLSKLISGFYFEAILLYGDPGKKRGLRVESDTSPYYPFKKDLKTECRLNLLLPAKNIPWMVLLKVSCLEENLPALHARHYGMKVVQTSDKAVGV